MSISLNFTFDSHVDFLIFFSLFTFCYSQQCFQSGFYRLCIGISQADGCVFAHLDLSLFCNSAFAYRLYFTFNFHRSHTCTTVKSVVANGLNSLWQCNSRQGCTIIECVSTNVRNLFRKNHHSDLACIISPWSRILSRIVCHRKC